MVLIMGLYYMCKFMKGGKYMGKLEKMVAFEELETVEELGDGWIAVGAVVGLGLVGAAVYLGIAT